MLNAKTVVALTGEPGVCVVTPEWLLTSEGETVWFQNLTKGVVVIYFENGRPFGQDNLKLEADETTGLEVSKGMSGGYAYMAYSDENKGWTDKARRPRMIVCRPITR